MSLNSYSCPLHTCSGLVYSTLYTYTYNLSSLSLPPFVFSIYIHNTLYYAHIDMGLDAALVLWLYWICADFTATYGPDHYVVPVRINGSAIESLLGRFKFDAAGR